MANTSRSYPITGFYLGQYPDSAGRMIEEIWSWDYQRLESVHDYIQWLFPLKHKSAFNPNAPVLSDEAIHAFSTNEALRRRLLHSLKLMLKFYGLQCVNDGDAALEISKAAQYAERKANWINNGNHNYLRVTRILTSLSILGLNNYAHALFKCLDQIYQDEGQNIGPTTYAYWKNSLDQRPAQ